jgi:hypothetical protein
LVFVLKLPGGIVELVVLRFAEEQYSASNVATVKVLLG